MARDGWGTFCTAPRAHAALAPAPPRPPHTTPLPLRRGPPLRSLRIPSRWPNQPPPFGPAPELFTWEFASDPYPTHSLAGSTHRAQDAAAEWGGGLAGDAVRGRQAGARRRAAEQNPAHHDEPARAKGKTGIPGEHKAELMTHLLNIDPPDHTRLRRLVSKAFARRVAEFAPRVQELTDQLIDQFAAKGSADLIHEFAFPLFLFTPFATCWACPRGPGRLPGLGGDDHAARWRTAGRGRAVGQGECAGICSSSFTRSGKVFRIHPRPVRTSFGPHPRLRPRRATRRNEAAAMAFILLFAGFETTVDLIGNGTYALLAHREQRARLQRSLAAGERGLLETGVEELLRYDGPVELATWRFATEAVCIGGQGIAPGDPVLVVLAAADRDPARFERPDTLDLSAVTTNTSATGTASTTASAPRSPAWRAEPRSPPFSPVSPDLQLAGDSADLRWRGGLIMRGLRTLPVEFTPPVPGAR